MLRRLKQDGRQTLERKDELEATMDGTEAVDIQFLATNVRETGQIRRYV
jgi:hypothetical protein